MAGFGVGLGSFLQGLERGVSTGANIQDVRSKKELRDMQMEELRQTNADKQQYRTMSQDGMTAAKANTDGQVDNVMNYYMQNTAPQLQQHWLATGDVQKAEAFGKWIKDANVQQGMRHSVGMMRSAMMGDADGFAKSLVAAYNQPGYFDNGFTVSNSQVLRDDKGNAKGMEVTLKDQDGKEMTHTFSSMAEVYQLAQQFGSPDQVFSAGMAALQSGQKTQAELAKEEREWQRTLAGKQVDQQFQLESQGNQSQLRRAEEAEKARTGAGSNVSRDAAAKIQLLKQSGRTDAEINALMPSIIGIENRNRPTSSRIDDYIKIQLEANHRAFSKLTPDEQIAKAMEYIEQVDSAAGSPSGGVGLPTNMQTQGGATPQQSGQQGGAGLTPFFDSKTGQIIYR